MTTPNSKWDATATWTDYDYQLVKYIETEKPDLAALATWVVTATFLEPPADARIMGYTISLNPERR